MAVAGNSETNLGVVGNESGLGHSAREECGWEDQNMACTGFVGVLGQ